MSDTVLVTGASGFIAGHLIHHLKEHGYTVRGTVRSRRTEHEALGIELVEADLLAPGAWAAAVDGCSRVFHTASPLPVGNPRHERELVEPAVNGTRHVLDACVAAGVERVVVTSSSAAVINVERPADHTYSEDDFSDPALCSPYPKSKTLAEQAAWTYADRLQVTTVNPVLVLGPVTNGRANASVEPIRRLVSRAMPAVPKLGFNLVDVRDVAAAHRLAMEVPEAVGQRYLLTAGFEWMGDVAQVLANAFPEKRVPTRHLPYPILWLAGRFDPGIRSILSEVGVRRTLSSEKARRELGWTTRDLDQSIVDTGRTLIEAGLA